MNKLAIPLALLLTTLAYGADHARLAPFSAVRWSDDEPEVWVNGQWYAAIAVGGVPVTEILAHSRSRHGAKWQKRFGEDLVQLFAEMGHELENKVTLNLRDLDSGDLVELDDVPMSESNRNSVLAFNRGTAGPTAAAGPVRRSSREHGPGSTGRWPGLTRRVEPEGPILPRERALDDLDQLEWSLENEFSYQKLRDVDHRAMLDEVRAAIGAGIGVHAFAIQISKVIAAFGDGHARVRGAPDRFVPRGYLPFLLCPIGERFVAVEADREGLVDARRPYVAKIDGRPIDEWVDAGAALVGDASPAFRRRHGARMVRLLAFMRQELDLPDADDVEVTLVDDRGRKAKKVRRPLADRKPIYGDWPRTESRELDGDIGYLRVADMDGDPAFLGSLRDRMGEFRDTRGLVIDVRGNGGGTRDALRVLFPYFLDDDADPMVVNLARKRLRPGEPAVVKGGLLANRTLFPRSSYDGAAGAAIDRLVERFQPQWTPDDATFSEWHYFVLGPDRDEGSYRYEQPVVVLQDAGCFSATDIFLGAFAELDGVTLMGTPSGGGSGRSRGFTLTHSGLSFKLSSMASFRPTGALYDTVGIAPDVLVEPEPGTFIGDGDVQLDAAIEHLKRRR